jgi:hypothetical protein
VRIEFHRPAAPVEPEPTPAGGKPPPPPPPEPAVAVVDWRDDRAEVEADDAALADRLRHAFRPMPVVVDDASLRSAGTSGESVLQPGDLEWVRAVALVRVPAETGLIARFVTGAQVGGYDPAANYRRFREQVAWLDARTSAGGSDPGTPEGPS